MDIVQQTQAEGANVTVTAKIWIKGERFRLESKHPMMGEQLIIMDGKNVYFLSPAQKAGQKGPVPTRDGKRVTVWQWLLADVNALRSKGKKVGRETIEGVPCDVYLGTEKKGSDSASIKAWIGTVQGTPLPMKVVLKESVSRPGASLARTKTMTIKNLKQGIAIADSRFVVPSGYKIATASGPGAPVPGVPGTGRR
jgi:outer membrane lipoprotein-sorting protein